ncbi:MULTISPECIES: Rha family transcriptional regulator [unclassified Clostridium]|uniref:Rha family transcriptional regulator n=1 Tax=unclassified Clostridium TaxID=2614128 RepID=UPI002079E14C|nr:MULTISPECIES: Rha family transcriptional regulator [unclassified Clostridium]
MNIEKVKNILDQSDFKEMTLTQINSYELILKKKGLKDKTIDRKIKNLLDFYIHLTTVKLNYSGKRIKFNKLNEILFEYIRDGYFGVGENIENEGSCQYRQNIYYNIEEGLNYIYEDMSNGREIIKSLNDEQKEILQEVSKNKWFKVCAIKEDETETFYDSLQVQLIEKLGIKVYFDNNNLPYVLSHELAELIGKPNKRILKDIRELSSKIQNTEEGKIALVEQNGLFTIVEGTYEVERKVGNNIGYSKEKTYRLYKNILLMYLLGLTGKEIIEFKIKYIQAFDYIEKEYNKRLIEHGKLKESFYKMYNEIRKKNRDLYVIKHNDNVKNKI